SMASSSRAWSALAAAAAPRPSGRTTEDAKGWCCRYGRSWRWRRASRTWRSKARLSGVAGWVSTRTTTEASDMAGRGLAAPATLPRGVGCVNAPALSWHIADAKTAARALFSPPGAGIPDRDRSGAEAAMLEHTLSGEFFMEFEARQRCAETLAFVREAA